MYDDLVTQSKSQSQFSDLADALRSDGGVPYLESQVDAAETKADVLTRLWELGGPGYVDVWGTLLNCLIAALVLGIAYLLFRRYRSSTQSSSGSVMDNLLPSATEPVMEAAAVAGKRLR
jgi:hypothetical protein